MVAKTRTYSVGWESRYPTPVRERRMRVDASNQKVAIRIAKSRLGHPAIMGRGFKNFDAVRMG